MVRHHAGGAIFGRCPRWRIVSRLTTRPLAELVQRGCPPVGCAQDMLGGGRSDLSHPFFALSRESLECERSGDSRQRAGLTGHTARAPPDDLPHGLPRSARACLSKQPPGVFRRCCADCFDRLVTWNAQRRAKGIVPGWEAGPGATPSYAGAPELSSRPPAKSACQGRGSAQQLHAARAGSPNLGGDDVPLDRAVASFHRPSRSHHEPRFPDRQMHRLHRPRWIGGYEADREH